MKTIEQFQPYQKAKQDMQKACRERQIARALIQILNIQTAMPLAPILGQDLALSNQAAMERWVMEQLRNTEEVTDENIIGFLVNSFERKIGRGII